MASTQSPEAGSRTAAGDGVDGPAEVGTITAATGTTRSSATGPAVTAFSKSLDNLINNARKERASADEEREAVVLPPGADRGSPNKPQGTKKTRRGRRRRKKSGSKDSDGDGKNGEAVKKRRITVDRTSGDVVTADSVGIADAGTPQASSGATEAAVTAKTATHFSESSRQQVPQTSDREQISTLDDKIQEMTRIAEKFLVGMNSISFERSEEMRRLKADHQDEVVQLREAFVGSKNYDQRLDKQPKDTISLRDQLEKQKKIYNQSLDTQRKAIISLREQVEKQKKDYDQTIDTQQKEIIRLRAEVGKQQLELKDAKDKSKTENAEVILKLRTELSLARGEIDHLRSGHEKQTWKALDGARRQHEVEVGRLTSTFESVRDELDKVRSEYAKAAKDLETVRNERDSVQEKVQRQNDLNVEISTELNELIEKYNELQQYATDLYSRI